MRKIRLLPTVIPVLWMVGLRCAAFGAAEAGAPEAEVVLEAGEIDARTVQGGARVMVIYGRGERHPVSGEWAWLDTTAGWVQAVDVSALVLARERDLRQQRISLDRIQRLVMPRGRLRGNRRSTGRGLPARAGPGGNISPSGWQGGRTRARGSSGNWVWVSWGESSGHTQDLVWEEYSGPASAPEKRSHSVYRSLQSWAGWRGLPLGPRPA